MQRIIVITGTDTGVGKTVLTALLTAHLVRQGVKVAALKPISSGHRGDARLLRGALSQELTLDTINPWHFHAPIAPVISARVAKRTVRLPAVISHIRRVAKSALRPEVIFVEGAGGLLSPLGEGFSTRELITSLRAEVFIVGLNRLGVVNQLLLTLEALPTRSARKARLVLMSEADPDEASRSNVALLAELTGGKHATLLPRFKDPANFDDLLARPGIRQTLDQLLG